MVLIISYMTSEVFFFFWMELFDSMWTTNPLSGDLWIFFFFGIVGRDRRPWLSFFYFVCETICMKMFHAHVILFFPFITIHWEQFSFTAWLLEMSLLLRWKSLDFSCNLQGILTSYLFIFYIYTYTYNDHYYIYLSFYTWATWHNLNVLTIFCLDYR